MYLGCLLIIGSYYYRKPIVYNSIYTWVILEEYMNTIKNKYFRNKINVTQYKNTSILEVFDTNFIYKKYIYLKDLDPNKKLNEYTNIDFTNINFFMSAVIYINDDDNIDITKDINLFINKNTKLTIDHEFTESINNFLNLDLQLTETNFTWIFLDKQFIEYKGTNMVFSFNEDIKLIKN